jgi:hypothetical protein
MFVIGPSPRSIFSRDWVCFCPLGPKGGLEGGLAEVVGNSWT